MKKFFTKLFFLVALFLLSTVGLLAKTVNVDDAKTIAHQFLTSNLEETAPEKMKRISPKASLSLAYEAKAQNGNSNLFVFNQGEQGFVVVAGDDCVSPILGYADSGAFDEKNMPEGFRYWLESCSCYIEKAKVGEIKREDMTIMRAQNRSYASYINPLLGDINFGQSYPYNDKCPMQDGERTIVGCVAVSMGQIMTYYQWPTQGKGSHSYVTSTDSISVSANFNTTYDWKNILHYYDYEDMNYNSTQKNAVAKMLFHCGASVNMDYGVDASGSSIIYVPKAMTEYFSYDKGMQVHHRAMYNFNDWKNLIKEELNSNRPIIYRAQSDEGGHAFNCDGYDSNDYFHINWGWYGYYNGYYDLRYLYNRYNEHPAYNRSHSIITGIKPDKGDGTETKTELAHNLMLTYGAWISDNEITYQVFNKGAGTFIGDIATGIYYEGELVHKYVHYSDVECDPNYGDVMSQDVSDWAKDNYEVQPIYRESGSSEWKPIPRENGMLSCFVYVDGYWTYYLKYIPQFKVNSLKAIGNLSSDKAPVFELNFTNTSNFDYYGDVWLLVSDDENLTNAQYSLSQHVVALSQETQTVPIYFPEALEEGNYYIWPFVDMKNGRIHKMFDENGDYYSDTVIIEYNTSSSTPSFELVGDMKLNKTTFDRGETIKATYTIRNNGESRYLNLGISIADLYENSSKTDLNNTTQVYLPAYSDKEITSTIVVPSDFEYGEYRIFAYYEDDVEGYYKFFIPIEFNAKHIIIEEEKRQPELEMIAPIQLNKASFYLGETLEASFTLRNIGYDGYVNVGLAIANSDGELWHPEIGDDMQTIYLSANSTKKLNFTIDIPKNYDVGTYSIIAYQEVEGYYSIIEPIDNSVVFITVEEPNDKYGKYDIYVTSNGYGEVIGAGRYEYGSEATIAAIPDYGYKFYRWSDKNKKNPRVVTVEGEATYEAEFRAITISLEAQPNDDAFEFVEWSDGESDNPRTISIAEENELQYVAIFRMKKTAIENAYITSAHVYSNSGNLYVIGAEDDYLVFDEVGKLIYSGKANSIQLPSGAYLVRLGKEIQKVIVL